MLQSKAIINIAPKVVISADPMVFKISYSSNHCTSKSSSISVYVDGRYIGTTVGYEAAYLESLIMGAFATKLSRFQNNKEAIKILRLRLFQYFENSELKAEDLFIKSRVIGLCQQAIATIHSSRFDSIILTKSEFIRYLTDYITKESITFKEMIDLLGLDINNLNVIRAPATRVKTSSDEEVDEEEDLEPLVQNNPLVVNTSVDSATKALQAIIEENLKLHGNVTTLQTKNKELQAKNEELQAKNEELQAKVSKIEDLLFK